MKIYQVGGSVRDKLLHQPAHDIDHVVVGSSIEQMLKMGFKQVGNNFPVFINPKNNQEYALARKEIKTGPKHTDFKFVFTPDISLADDLERRDFTCNALAWDEETDQIIDFHNGINDINNKILRHVNSQHFAEDPLRILRMCRFVAQLDFTPAEETIRLTTQMVAEGQLNYLTAERIWQEIFKALQTKHFDKFISTARQIGTLKAILPEIDILFNIPERTDYHPEGNTGEHTLLCLRQASDENALVKFAVLVHDVGKSQTPKNILPSHHGHETAGEPIVKQICNRLKIPNNFTHFAALSCRQHMKLHLVRQMKISTLIKFINSFNRKNLIELNNFLAVCRADHLGRARQIPKSEQQNFEQDHAFTLKVAQILSQIKATDMPNFTAIPKDKNFATKFFEFQIKTLQTILNK